MKDAPACRGLLPCDSPLNGETLDLDAEKHALGLDPMGGYRFFERSRSTKYLERDVDSTSNDRTLTRGRVAPSHPIGHFLGDLGPGLLGVAVQIIPRQHVL
jgi:hypothetical protein